MKGLFDGIYSENNDFNDIANDEDRKKGYKLMKPESKSKQLDLFKKVKGGDLKNGVQD